MKTTKLFASLFVALSLLLVGCKPEQSEMTLDQLTTKAVVAGTIVYDAGVDINSDNQYQVNQIVPAAERTIYVEIPYSQYGNATNQSNKIFETTTDSVGAYSIEIPTTPKGLDVNSVTVRMKEFTTLRSEFKKMENGAPVFETQMYRYSYTQPVPVSLKPGTSYNFDNNLQLCDKEPVELKGLDETITFKGKINIAYEKNFRQGDYQALANASLIFTAKYSLLPGEEFEFGTVTDAEGNYSITLPIENYDKGFDNLEVRALGVGASYKHYYEVGKSVELNGAYYNSNNVLDGIALSEIIEGMEYRMPEQFLKFTPNFNNNITTGTNPSTWEKNLAGWERYDGFNQTQTVKGQILCATETAFGIASFNNEMQETQVIIGYPGSDARGGSKTVVVNTDKNGNFSFDVPVLDAQEELTITLPSDIMSKKMTHYLSDGSKIRLSGNYTIINDAIRDMDAEWNEAGLAYYSFAPATVTPEMEWNADLVGWKKANAEYNKLEAALTITADVKLPTETAWGVGSYVPANNMIVNFNVDGETYAVAVANGKAQFTVYAETPSAEPSVNVAGLSKKEKAFRHFDINGKERTLSGKYEHYYSIAQADRDEWNKLGEVYCRFVPEGTVDNWNNWFAFLAGWVRIDDAPQAQNVTGSIFLLSEASYGVGMTESAANTLVKLNVNGTRYVALTDANGMFNVPVYYDPDAPDPTVSVEPYFQSNQIPYTHYSFGNKKLVIDANRTSFFREYRINGYDTWYDLKGYYYRAPAPYSSTKILEWENTYAQKALKYNQQIIVSAKVKRAEERVTGSSVEAKWANDNETRLVTLTINGKEYQGVSRSGNINFRIYVEDATAAAYLNPMISIVPESGSSDAKIKFYHYLNQESTRRTEIYGYYQSANNLATPLSYTLDATTKTVTISTSAKMMFIPTDPAYPTDWTMYSWDVTLED